MEMATTISSGPHYWGPSSVSVFQVPSKKILEIDSFTSIPEYVTELESLKNFSAFSNAYALASMYTGPGIENPDWGLKSWKDDDSDDLTKPKKPKHWSKKWPTVNPVTFFSQIRGAFEEDVPMSEGEKIGWKVANYSWTLLDIGVGIASGDITTIIDIIGLGITFFDDLINFDSLWGRDTTDYTEKNVWINRNQGFKFEDPAKRLHIFKPLQKGLTGNEETIIYFPLKRDGNANMIELKKLENNDLVQGYRQQHPTSTKDAKFQIGPFLNLETNQDV